MNDYFLKIVDLPYEITIEKVTKELNEEGLGVLTDIDVKATGNNG